MSKAYYAHCQAIYDTPQELRDIATIEDLGYTCVNPNSEKVIQDLKAFKSKNPDENYMEFFHTFAQDCDLLVFRALPDGSIPCGVYTEIQWFLELLKPVIELPSGLERRKLDLAKTREYLRESGQR